MSDNSNWNLRKILTIYQVFTPGRQSLRCGKGVILLAYGVIVLFQFGAILLAVYLYSACANFTVQIQIDDQHVFIWSLYAMSQFVPWYMFFYSGTVLYKTCWVIADLLWLNRTNRDRSYLEFTMIIDFKTFQCWPDLRRQNLKSIDIRF